MLSKGGATCSSWSSSWKGVLGDEDVLVHLAWWLMQVNNVGESLFDWNDSANCETYSVRLHLLQATWLREGRINSPQNGKADLTQRLEHKDWRMPV